MDGNNGGTGDVASLASASASSSSCSLPPLAIRPNRVLCMVGVARRDDGNEVDVMVVVDGVATNRSFDDDTDPGVPGARKIPRDVGKVDDFRVGWEIDDVEKEDNDNDEGLRMLFLGCGVLRRGMPGSSPSLLFRSGQEVETSGNASDLAVDPSDVDEPD